MNRKQRRAGKKSSGRQVLSEMDLMGRVVQRRLSGESLGSQAMLWRVLAGCPTNADAINQLGVISLEHQKVELARRFFSRAISIDHHVGGYYCNLGNALKGQGFYQGAWSAYIYALALAPENAIGYVNLSSLTRDRRLFQDALSAGLRAIRIEPNLTQAYSNLANALNDTGLRNQAITAYRTALALKPDYARAFSNLGSLLREAGRLKEAKEVCQRSIEVVPLFSEGYANLGTSFTELNILMLGIRAFQTAVLLEPNFAGFYSNFGNALKEIGDLVGAIAAYRKAMAIDPDLAEANSNLVFSHYYREDFSGTQILEEARNFAQHYELNAFKFNFYNVPERGRRLRIGYVSGDFRRHSVGYFLEPLFLNHDKSAVEIYCYANNLQNDEVTAQLRSHAHQWRCVFGMSDDVFADIVVADRIDVLVDLSGHTALNRLRLFTRRPAPVQVTWLGCPGTTGLSSIDYRLVDNTTDPQGETDSHASERLVRLPGCFVCYGPPQDAPEPKFIRKKNDPIVFGSFNNPSKLSPATIDVWAQILAKVPDARLLLKGRPFGDPEAQGLYLSRFAERGIGTDRITLVGHVESAAHHLELYSQVDIALDPFPYNGTTTTCEALWMGVPVVALMGDRHSSRVSASLLSEIGLNELVGKDVEAYIEIAVSLTTNIERLENLRRTLRPRMASSSLCDGKSFAQKIEVAFRQMWLRWCNNQGQSSRPMEAPGQELFDPSSLSDSSSSNPRNGPRKSGAVQTVKPLLWNHPKGLWLHIGGQIRQAGWTVIDALPGSHVDIVGDCRNLSMVGDGSCAVIYSSHVLEHLGYDADLPSTLRQFKRKLAPHGLLLTSVPDLDVLCRLFVDSHVDASTKFMIMRMIFGGRATEFDVHYSGLNFDFIHSFLSNAGFVDIKRVPSLGCFNDTSEMRFLGVPISLNVIARNPG